MRPGQPPKPPVQYRAKAAKPVKDIHQWRKPWLQAMLSSDYLPLVSACQKVGMDPSDFLDETLNPKFRDWLSQHADAYGFTLIHMVYMKLCYKMISMDFDVTKLSAPLVSLLGKLAERFDPKAMKTSQVLHQHSMVDFEEMSDAEQSEWLADNILPLVNRRMVKTRHSGSKMIDAKPISENSG